MSVKILIGDVRERLRELPDESVHCVVTSPPYWGLRDYGVPGQLGLEATPEEHVRVMVEVFREVRRVMRSDGVLFLNYGDSYQGKQLLGMPWRIALALQADGWWLRSEIIWAKPNAMPESVTDRPAKSHEHLFLLAKSATYHYDADAVRQPHAAKTLTHRGRGTTGKLSSQDDFGRVASGSWAKNVPVRAIDPRGCNLRDVWTIPTEPFPGRHFAVFPQALVEPCIKAGTSEHGCCSTCGAPWVRERDRQPGLGDWTKDRTQSASTHPGRSKRYREMMARGTSKQVEAPVPGCDCAAAVVPCTVLDPFGGVGTVCLVADKLGRSAVLIELNPEYAAMAERRIRDDCPLFAEVKTE